jgi:DNA invertase Pin-like site-specific DNA recombinase
MEAWMPPLNRVPVERVRQLLAQGVTASAICRRLAINKGSVSQIKTQMQKESQGCTTTSST